MKSDFALGPVQRCLLTSIVSKFLVSRIVIGRSYSFAFRYGGTNIKSVTCWLCLRPCVLLIVQLWCFMWHVVVFFRIAIADHCVLALLSLSHLLLLAMRFSVFVRLKGATDLAEAGVHLPLPASVHAFVAILGLFSVPQRSHFDLKEVYTVYHRIDKVHWKDEASI